MALRITVTDASEISDGVWSFDLPPHQVRQFGDTGHRVGDRSVLILRASSYDAESKQLHFGIDDSMPINIGTTAKALGIAANVADAGTLIGTAGTTKSLPSFGPGDREFIRLAKAELSTATAEIAESLLQAVRHKSPGDLKRGQSRNFSETPDNFWYVIVQPRIDELSITVRGSVKHFKPVAKLEIKDDRGNTRFKVRGKADLPAALALIFHARRKS